MPMLTKSDLWLGNMHFGFKYFVKESLLPGLWPDSVREAARGDALRLVLQRKEDEVGRKKQCNAPKRQGKSVPR